MMIITLEELIQAAARLPDPNLRDFDKLLDMPFRVQIVEQVPVDSPTPASVNVRYATFRVRKYSKNGAIIRKWSPIDEVVI